MFHPIYVNHGSNINIFQHSSTWDFYFSGVQKTSMYKYIYVYIYICNVYICNVYICNVYIYMQCMYICNVCVFLYYIYRYNLYSNLI